MTVVSRVVAYVLLYPGHSVREITKGLRLDLRQEAGVASVLKKLVDREELKRIRGNGPRGGYAYYPRTRREP